MPTANSADLRIMHIMEDWEASAKSEIDDIAGWRGAEKDRDGFADDPRRAWRAEPAGFFNQTTLLVAWIRDRHPGVDPSPFEDIYQAVRAWHTDHNDSRVVNQGVLNTWMDRATTILVTVHQTILARQGQGILAAPMEQADPIPADLESTLEAFAPCDLARKWVDLARQYPFWDYRQGLASIPGDLPRPAPEWMQDFKTQREAMAWFRTAAAVLARQVYKLKPDYAGILLRIYRDTTTDASNKGDVTEAMPLVDELVIHLELTPQAGVTPSDKDASDQAMTFTNEQLLAGLLKKYPDWTAKQFAKALGCHEKSIYRMETYKSVRKIQKAERSRFPRGRKSKSGDMEAYDNDDE